MALNLTVHKPSVCIKDAVCAIPCTVENTYATTQEVRIYLYEGTKLLDREPDTHYQDIPTGTTYEFDGFWDTLKFTPTTVKTYGLTVKLRTTGGFGTARTCTIPCEEKPGFFDSLLTNIGLGNKEQITDPIDQIFQYEELAGFTTPPFTCPLCSAKFGKENGTKEENETATIAFIQHLATGINDTISALHIRGT